MKVKNHVLIGFVLRLFDLLSNITYPNLIVGLIILNGIEKIFE
jgi:hypothetical protein